MRRTAFALAALVTAGLPPALGAQDAGGTYRLAGDRVAVYNLAGRVTIEAADGGDVTVTVARGGADGARLDVETGPVDGRTALRVVYPGARVVYREPGFSGRSELTVREDGTFGGERRGGRRVTIASEGSGVRAWADLTIRIPSGRDAAVHHAVGSVTVRNVDGTLLVDTHSATVDVAGTRGALTVDVGSGSIAARNVQGRVVLDTGSGDVTLGDSGGDEILIDTGSGGVRATGVRARRLIVDTGSGDVELARIAADVIRLDTGSGSISVALTADVSDLMIDTGSGDVTVRAPASLGATLAVETGSGGIDADIPMTVTRRGRTALQATVGDGSGRIVIDTGSGDVSLLRGE